ncbi:TKL family protein kinase [Trichomonas vaginalis G3]|uniref:TKL family protein kinase n=1 Tax=Trichomonas vaginalis (strain ATCC PRA-98 / G3) TaxID=412133 RepID=A2E2L8_TRIV3|nr:protein kinase protein [Trichomonas vaginalis G3]EAY13046.1 TKL family protein kinase [Trichomonas vaginalis G3]KAI5548235.1 protein kinase protein [Trichomonas vaginalis G3]|eukprot:XP_001325269.1 TKL family protein kinase [Trichomonas vaginalis G3]
MNRQPEGVIPQFEQLLEELEKLLMQTVVHKKKFEFAFSQFRKFIEEYSQDPSSNTYLNEHEDIKLQINNAIMNFRDVLLQYDKHRWTLSTVDNPSNTAGTALCSIVSKLQQIVSTFTEAGSKCFDPESPQWLQYHILDLKYIQSSFKNYLELNNDNSENCLRIEKRLESIDNFINQYEKESAAIQFRVFSPIPLNYQSWRLNHKDLNKVKEIGHGVSSVVYYGYDNRTKNEVAIKELKYPILSGPSLNQFQRELTVLATARHPRVLGFVGATETAPYCIVTEWMGGGTLYNILHSPKPTNPTMLSICMYDIARGMQFLHSRHIVHRDLKSLNVLFDNKGLAHIGDFGFSRREDDKMTQSIGTPHWMAPELLATGSFYTNKVDVYAYGIVLWEILTKQYPYNLMDPQQIVAQVLANDLRPEIPENSPPRLASLIKKCWDRNPDARPSFDRIVSELQQGNTLLEGADRKVFLEYTAQFVTQISDQSYHIESQLEEQTTTNDENKFIDFVITLEKEGIPPNLVDRCWQKFLSSNSMRDEVRARCAVLFLKTSMKNQVSLFLRKLPRKSIPIESITWAVELIPTGSEDIDTNIVVTACKNGCADASSVYAVNPNHIKLSLECVAQNGVRENLKAAVADRCVQCLGSSDPSMVCTALRCLVGIGEMRRITPSAIKACLSSSDESVQNCIFVAGSALVREGISVPNEFIDSLLKEFFSKRQIVITCVIISCKDTGIASKTLDLIKNNLQSVEISVLLRIFFSSAQHIKLRPKIREIMESMNPETMENDMKQRYEDLLQRLKSD